MKVIINDLEALKSIKPEQAIGYLQTHGWQKQKAIGNLAEIWSYQNSSDIQANIILPHYTDIPGYPMSVSIMLATLESVLQISQLEILNSILKFSKDTNIDA
jgi:hypothetical protein